MITVIGISGKKTTGKDTLCQLMLKNAAVRGCRIAFADAVKEEVAKAIGKTPQFVETNKERFRPILQWWGTDYRRYWEGDDYWVNQAILKIDQKIREGNELIIIPDVRFISEAESLRELGAHLIRISRPIVSEDKHISETELDSYKGFNHIILNSGSLSLLEEEACVLLSACRIPIKS